MITFTIESYMCGGRVPEGREKERQGEGAVREFGIVIVDPYSSGSLFAERLQSSQIRCMAVQSSSWTPRWLKAKCDPSLFEHVVIHRGDLSETAAQVRRWQPTHVVAGFESGVDLAGDLASALELPGNDPSLRNARRDKAVMAEAVARRGIRTPKQFCDRDVDAILKWIRSEVSWPVIVKPTRSAASDDVHRCCNPTEVREAVSGILGRSNVLGEINERVVVQEYLDGTEYAIDMVCSPTERVITAFWRYHRPAGSDRFVGYDQMTLLPYDGTRQRALEACAVKVADALGIRHGPAHCELMWVDDEPAFIEMGARFSGGINGALSHLCGGYGQFEMMIELMVAPDRFRRRASRRPRLRKRAANLFLMPARSGRLVQTRGLEQIRALATLHSFSIASTPGVKLDRVAGRITLLAEDPAAIEADVQRIRRLERQGMFELEH